VKSNNYKYGNSFTWDGINYTLTDTVDSLGIPSDISTHLYTCWDTTGVCNKINYVYDEDDAYGYPELYYITLSDGKSIDDALNEMLYNDDVNTNNSNVKKDIDKWFTDNLASYVDQLSDTLFCNDRLLVSDNIFRGGNSAQATLKCNQQNDRFTVSDTTIGNGALTYPIAIPTSDEYLLAGVREGSYNQRFYLYANGYTLTMTPSSFTNNSRFQANMNMISANGNIAQAAVNWDSNIVMKPVINLKRGVLINGSGTINDPYTA